MKRIVLIIATLSGCADAQTIPVNIEWYEPRDNDLLDETEELMGYSIERVSYKYGAVSVTIVDDRQIDERRLRGYAFDNRGCRRAVLSETNPMTLAHVLGHTLGLAHNDDPDDIMYEDESLTGDGFALDQMDTMDRTLRDLRACRLRGTK